VVADVFPVDGPDAAAQGMADELVVRALAHGHHHVTGAQPRPVGAADPVPVGLEGPSGRGDLDVVVRLGDDRGQGGQRQQQDDRAQHQRHDRRAAGRRHPSAEGVDGHGLHPRIVAAPASRRHGTRAPVGLGTSTAHDGTALPCARDVPCHTVPP
jgi:hypothetical protein